ncbi:MAG TPA: hypothetical protein VHQ23_18905 [Ilumatobacteraceae bacterium]|nr:hypothetical protein [Ilumatobacteraceae bacterium]
MIVAPVGATLGAVTHRETELSEGDEMDALARSYPGLIHQLRMEDLGRRVRKTNGLAIAESRRGFCGDRLTMWLDSGDVLRLRLFWPIRSRALAALGSIVWDDRVGWIVEVRTSSGEVERVFAWRAQLEHRPLPDW